jgi:hypothetical protein
MSPAARRSPLTSTIGSSGVTEADDRVRRVHRAAEKRIAPTMPTSRARHLLPNARARAFIEPGRSVTVQELLRE